jgi:hypothetical protein
MVSQQSAVSGGRSVVSGDFSNQAREHPLNFEYFLGQAPVFRMWKITEIARKEDLVFQFACGSHGNLEEAN